MANVFLLSAKTERKPVSVDLCSRVINNRSLYIGVKAFWLDHGTGSKYAIGSGHGSMTMGQEFSVVGC